MKQLIPEICLGLPVDLSGYLSKLIFGDAREVFVFEQQNVFLDRRGQKRHFRFSLAVVQPRCCFQMGSGFGGRVREFTPVRYEIFIASCSECYITLPDLSEAGGWFRFAE